MAIVRIITVGTLKESYLKEAVDEYKKRISQFARVEMIELKEERIANEDDRTAVAKALEAEGDRILSAAEGSGYCIALCVEGKQLSSEELALTVESALDSQGKLTLIIGSSHGLCPRVKQQASLRLSFSKLTFPHQLMRAVLMESLYRSFTIIHGKKYHK